MRFCALLHPSSSCSSIHQRPSGGACQSSHNIMDTSLPLVWSSAFHSGARAPDEKFSQRLGAVVSMPFVSPQLSYNENGLWVHHVMATCAFTRRKEGHVGLCAPSHAVRKTSLLPAVELRPDSPDTQVSFKYDLHSGFLSLVYGSRDARCHRIQDKTLDHRKYGVEQVLRRSQSLAGDWADGGRSLFSVSSTTTWDSGYHLELGGRIRTRFYILFVRPVPWRIAL